MSKLIISSLILFISLFLASCGGDEEESSIDPALDATENEAKQEEIDEVEDVAKKVPVEAPKKERKIPDPNGVYLPTGEEKNGKPVYANADGFTMWYNGSTWRITDRTGGGNLVASGKESINQEWSKGG